MSTLTRRSALVGAAAALASPALAQQTGHQHHAPMFERLQQPGAIPLPDLHHEQKVLDSPAPRATPFGRWVELPQMPIPRTEMAWAVERGGKMHLVGGYAEQRVDMPYHHAYDPVANRWETLQALPRGANHVGVATHRDRVYAFGGFIEQNRFPHKDVFVFGADGERWSRLRPLPRACGAIACVALGDNIHLVGGAIGNTAETRVSIDWHLVYDVREDRYRDAAPMPLGRDHTGIVIANNVVHVIGGRVNTFHTNSALHHTYDPREDRWRMRMPMPTQRSGHGAVVFQNRIHCMGGEGTNRVFGTHEAFDLSADRWVSYAPMATPRHGMGAVLLGNRIHVAGGGPIVGGGVKSAIHEVFELL